MSAELSREVRARRGDPLTGVSGGPATEWTRVVLVGLMGSGKTTVGRVLAARLGWGFVDLDDEVEATSGRSVEELFRERGEAAFRELESRAGSTALAHSRSVLAPGGGWFLAPGRLDELPPGTLTVWLDVTAETAVRRATAEGRVRPLLGAADPVARARSLLAARKPMYARALLHLDSEHMSPEALARAIAEHVEPGR